jgi:hypothetical protein
MIGRLFYAIYIVLAAWVQTRSLPEPQEIDAALLDEPIQAPGTDRENFEFAYRGKDYVVRPKADYELWGLVVSKNNIGAWYNYYHDENSVNLKDVCVVWGENIRNGAYRDDKISFKSGEWTCYYQWSGQLSSVFYPDKMSNNHLLSDSVAVQDAIRGINVGDQIHLKGALVDYAEKGTEWFRTSSLTRKDSGNGACEVFLIDRIDILKQNKLYWNYLYNWKWRILMAVAVINIIWFFYSARRDAPITHNA